MLVAGASEVRYYQKSRPLFFIFGGQGVIEVGGHSFLLHRPRLTNPAWHGAPFPQQIKQAGPIPGYLPAAEPRRSRRPVKQEHC